MLSLGKFADGGSRNPTCVLAKLASPIILETAVIADSRLLTQPLRHCDAEVSTERTHKCYVHHVTCKSIITANPLPLFLNVNGVRLIRLADSGLLSSHPEQSKGLSTPRICRIALCTTSRALLQVIVSERYSVSAAGPYARVSAPGNFPMRAIPRIIEDVLRCHNSVPKILKPEWPDYQE